MQYPAANLHSDDRRAHWKWRTCLSKHSHSKGKAKRLAKTLSKNAYQCPVCNRWHLTSKEVS